MGAAIARGGNAPENQDVEQQPAEIIRVGDRDAEEIAKQDGDEDVDGDNADEGRRRELDAVDEAVHDIALH